MSSLYQLFDCTGLYTDSDKPVNPTKSNIETDCFEGLKAFDIYTSLIIAPTGCEQYYEAGQVSKDGIDCMEEINVRTRAAELATKNAGTSTYRQPSNNRLMVCYEIWFEYGLWHYAQYNTGMKKQNWKLQKYMTRPTKFCKTCFYDKITTTWPVGLVIHKV